MATPVYLLLCLKDWMSNLTQLCKKSITMPQVKLIKVPLFTVSFVS